MGSTRNGREPKASSAPISVIAKRRGRAGKQTSIMAQDAGFSL